MDKKLKCIYDPLKELIEYFEKIGSSDITKSTLNKHFQPTDKILINHIVEGNKSDIEKDLIKALRIYSPLEIINEILLEGMKIVGELFSSGKMQLPFVLQSAECMKYCVEYLEQFLDKSSKSVCKGVIILATVKGDVHDIGKNLVDIILSNNGYKVVNLGIKCPLEKMIDAYFEHNADAIGMSGLLVKSTFVMKENLEILNKRNLNIPVILGGAALTRKFVETELRTLYNGLVFYAKDAFDGLKYMSKIPDIRKEDISNRTKEFIYVKNIIIEKEISDDNKISISKEKIIRNRVNTECNIPTPPFWGCRIVEQFPVEKIFDYINEKILFAGRWKINKTKDISEKEYNNLINTVAKPKLRELKSQVIGKNLFTPKAIYGYYPCNSEKEDLIIYKPKSIKDDKLFSEWEIKKRNIKELKQSDFVEWKSIKFPRQKSGSFLCISDYFKPIESELIDLIPIQIVTLGHKATEYSNELYKQNKYQEYLFFHGLAIEYTEALADYLNEQIRKELNLFKDEGKEYQGAEKKFHQGIRFSFGYPACPDLENTQIIFDILMPERIGITLTEEFQMVPEQSTNAIIIHRKDAKYFSAG